MTYRIGAVLGVAAILAGSATLPTAVLADENAAAAAASETTAVASDDLRQELEARLQKDAEAVAADALSAASDLDLPLEPAYSSPGTLVLVSEL